jgi:hypothetical protein
MADIFISYKRSDRARVEAIATLLEKAGFSIWFDSKLEPGQSEGFDEEINAAINAAAMVVVCWTHGSMKSKYVKAEAKKGFDRDILIPVLLEDCAADLPVPFNVLHGIDFTSWDGSTKSEVWKFLVDRATTIRARRNAIEESKRVYLRAASGPVHPGVLQELANRVDRDDARQSLWKKPDAASYHADIVAMLSLFNAMLESEIPTRVARKGLPKPGVVIRISSVGGGKVLSAESKRADQLLALEKIGESIAENARRTREWWLA